MKVFGYLRVSTKAQADNGSSLDTQKDSISDYIFRQGIECEEVIWVSDAGISASKTRTSRRLGWSSIVSTSQKGDVIVAAALDRVFRSVGDAVLTMESLQEKGLELHTVDKGRVTGGDAAFNLQLNVLNSVAQFESELKSKRIREVKDWMTANHLWVGGKRKRGFTKERIGAKVFSVVDATEKIALEWILELKKKRDKELSELQEKRGHGSVRIAKDSRFTIENIQKSLTKRGEKQGIVDLGNRFKRATLFILLGNDETTNVVGRLKQIKDNEKKILKVDDEFVLAADKASTSRREAPVDGGHPGGKQMSLMSQGGGLRSRQKKDKAVSTRKLVRA